MSSVCRARPTAGGGFCHTARRHCGVIAGSSCRRTRWRLWSPASPPAATPSSAACHGARTQRFPHIDRSESCSTSASTRTHFGRGHAMAADGDAWTPLFRRTTLRSTSNADRSCWVATWAACPIAAALRTVCPVSDAIEIKDLVKTFGKSAGSRRPGSPGGDGRGPRLPRAQRGRQVDHHPRPARPAPGRLGQRRACSAAPRGATPSSCTAGSRTCRATSPCGRTSPVAEVIDLLGRLRGGIDGRRRDELLERFELDPTKKGHAYSKGNRQKVALVAALASDVELLPARRAHRGTRPAHGGRVPRCPWSAPTSGRTVLLSSHILAEVEALCDRVSIIRLGRIVETGTLDRAAPSHPHRRHGETARPITGLSDLSGVHDAIVEGVRARFDVDTDQRLEEALAHLLPLGIRSLTSQPPTLEELFLRHYGDEDSPSVTTRLPPCDEPSPHEHRSPAAGEARAAPRPGAPSDLDRQHHAPRAVHCGQRERPLQDRGRALVAGATPCMATPPSSPSTVRRTRSTPTAARWCSRSAASATLSLR